MEVMLMMSVKEYAEDVSVNVKKILELCKNLGINANDEEDMLDDDAIIMLDNEIENNNFNEDLNAEEVDEELETEELDEEVEDNTNIKTENKKSNNKKKKNTKQPTNKKNEFMKKRKEMYKHKDKLKTNTVVLDDNVVLY